MPGAVSAVLELDQEQKMRLKKHQVKRADSERLIIKEHMSQR